VLGAAFLLLVVFALFAYQYLQDGTSFNSDQLYCFQFCDDLLHGRDVQGFHLPAAPYLFPDMMLLLACNTLTSNLVVLAFLYGALFYSLLLAVLFALGRGVGLPRGESFVLAALGLTLMLAVHFDPAYTHRREFMFYPGNHMGCLLIGLGMTAFLLRVIRNGYTWLSAGLFLLVATLTASSDQLLVVQFIVPICGSTLLLALCRRFPARRAVVTVVLMGVSILLAMKARAVLTRLGFVPMRITQVDAVFDISLGDSFLEFTRSAWHMVRAQPIMCIVFVLHIAGILTILTVSWRRSPRVPDAVAEVDSRPEGAPRLLLALVLLLGVCCNAGALIVTGWGKECTILRYLYTWWFPPFLCLLLWPRLLSRRATRLAVGAVVAVVLFRVGTFPEPLRADRLTRRYPPLAQALDEMVRKHGRMRGLADFWRARELHYLTREQVEVLPILTWGIPWFHAINPNGYLSRDPRDLTIPDYHFVIVPTNGESGPAPEHILARFGKPVEVVSIPDYEIWRYERLESRQLELFLRAQLAQRLVHERPFVAPSEPRTLGKLRRNLTPPNARGLVPLDHGGSLTLRFDAPVTGRTIDISANCSDEFLLHFSCEGRELGTTRVPAVPWTGVEIAYCPPGLQSRLVAVPPACRSGGFDEVRLAPLDRTQQVTVGHFLVFDEWIPYHSRRGVPTESYHRYEGEQMARLDSAEITTIADPTASAGQARRAAASFKNFLAYGPYFPLAPGRYRVDFALKVEDNTCTDTVAEIDSSACGGWQRLQSRPLRGVDFASAQRYQVFSLTFDTEDELDLVEFRVLAAGKAAVTLDHVDVTRVSPGKSSESCEP
jgi:hypothetical protein